MLNRWVVALLCLAAPVHAEHRVVLVVPPPGAGQGGDALVLETSLGRSPDLSLISRGAQIEILRGLALPPSVKVDEALALRMGQLSGADAVIHGFPAPRLCHVEKAACAPVGTPAEILSAVGAAPATIEGAGPGETANPKARAAYADCRAAVSIALEQAAVKGRKHVVPGLEPECRKALTADPKCLLARGAVAAAQALGGDAKSEKALKEAIAQLPGDPIPHLALINLLRRADRDEEAAAALAQAEKDVPSSIDVRRLSGERYFGMDLFGEALPGFSAAVDLAPRSPYLHWRLSYALHMGGRDKDAIWHAERASQLSGGTHRFFQEEYGSRLIDVGRYSEAQAVFEPLRLAEPTWGRAALRLGWALYKQGKAKEAIPHLEVAAKAPPREPREKQDEILARLDLARVYSGQGELDGAFRELAALQKQGRLEAIDLKDAEFDPLRADPRFEALPK